MDLGEVHREDCFKRSHMFKSLLINTVHSLNDPIKQLGVCVLCTGHNVQMNMSHVGVQSIHDGVQLKQSFMHLS